MGQAVIAENCQYCCCCCDQPDADITNEIKRKPLKKKRKIKAKAKVPILKQSLSGSGNIIFARLEDAQPSESDQSYHHDESKEITDNNYHKLNQISNTNTVTNTDSFEITHSIFIQMDNAIGKYYQQHGIDNYYAQNDTQGKFLKYVMTNNYNPNDIESQFAESINVNNCNYIQFDYDNFPINNNNNISKDEQIFNVLKHCYTHGNVPYINTINTQTSKTEIKTDTHAPIDDLNMIQNNNDDDESQSLSNSMSNTAKLHHEIQTSEQYESDKEENNLIPNANDIGLYNDYDKKEISKQFGEQNEYDTNLIETANDMNKISNKTVIEQINPQSVDSYIKQKQSNEPHVSDANANDTNGNSVTRNRADTHKILIQPPLSTMTATSVDSYMRKKHNNNDLVGDSKKRMDIHAKYDRDLYLEREIGKLDTGKWEYGSGNSGVNLEHGPDKIVKEDTSWVKTKRRVSYHSPHESLAKLQLKKVVSKGKLFGSLLMPIDDDNELMEANVLSRNNRAYSMPPVNLKQ